MRRGMILSLVLSLLVLAGCGGGGGGGNSGTPSVTTSTISGVASKGPISGGTVTVYGVTSSGAKDSQIGTAKTNPDGSYTLTIGSYTGPVIVEVTGGTYKDEVSGQTVNAPTMHAVANASSSTTLAVTPLTEMAYQNVGSTITPMTVNQANFLVGSLFNNIDIISTLPADATAPSSTATPKQKEYAVILGGISQLSHDTGSTVSTLLQNQLAISGGKLANQTAVASAVSSFNISDKNKTGVSVTISAPVQAPTVTLQASRASAYANGIDAVTLTALFSTAVADNTAIEFQVTSGTATLSGGASTATAYVKDGKVTVDVVSKTAGTVAVTAKLTATATATAQVSFTAPPALGASASASTAVANGKDNVTITAMPSSTSATGSVTFTVTSGAGTLDNGTKSKTVALTNGAASVGLTAGSAGSVEVTASYTTVTPALTAKTTVTFTAPPTTTAVTASKALGVANGADVVTFTATPSPLAATYTSVTFEITSGTATFDNNTKTKTVALASDGAARAEVHTSTAGAVEVTATYAGTAGKATASFMAPVTLSVSKSLGLANGTDSITITAQTAAASGYSDVTFQIKSGTGTLSATTVPLQNGAASVTVRSATAGSVIVGAAYAVSSANATVTFSQAASAMVEVGLKATRENVYFLAFRVEASSGSVSSPTAVPINEAAGIVTEPIKVGDVTSAIAAFALTKSDVTKAGYNIYANKPVARITYAVVSGAPQFAVVLDPQVAPLGLTAFDSAGNPLIQATKPSISASDFYISVTYKDASGNTL